jgi:uncharacterized protein (DUF1501 family)
MLRPDRRDFLRLGIATGAGLVFGEWPAALRAEQKVYAVTEGTAKAVIQIFLPGGIAHQDTWDPKPDAPLDYRGETEAISTALGGVQFGKLLAQTARVADRLTLCRAVTHEEAAHERGIHNVFTGYRPSPALVYPSMGSVIARMKGGQKGLPPYVCIPRQPTPFAGPGYLSSAFAPFSVGGDPGARAFHVHDLELPKGVDEARFARRRALLAEVDAPFHARTRSDAVDGMDAFYAQAYALLDSPDARAAFDLSAEPAALRDRYGRDQIGQGLLLARRLAEAGVRWTTVAFGGWDHHDDVFNRLRRELPPFDRAFAALIGDLDARGLLDSTLVLVTSEFGRTPKVNKTGGRDHWPKVFSLVMAGGGLRRGLAYGTSDATASEPEDDALTIEDWATTVYHLQGVVADGELMAPGGRPIEIVKDGRVRRELLA